jgi:hypothetical protein
VETQGDVPGHIAASHSNSRMSSWVLSTGLCELTHRNFEIFDLGGNICAPASTHRLAMHTGFFVS